MGSAEDKGGRRGVHGLSKCDGRGSTRLRLRVNVGTVAQEGASRVVEVAARVLLQSAKACGEMEDGALEPRLRIGAKASHWRRDFTLWRRGCQCALWLTLVL